MRLHRLPSIFELLLPLLDPLVYFFLQLSQLQLSPENLIFFLFKSRLCFLQTILKTLLFNLIRQEVRLKTNVGWRYPDLQTPPLFFKFLDGPAPISQLVQQVPDLLREVFIFSLDEISLLPHLLPGGLEAAQLQTVVS